MQVYGYTEFHGEYTEKRGEFFKNLPFSVSLCASSELLCDLELIDKQNAQNAYEAKRDNLPLRML